jgi:hypothetical protein
MKPKYLLTCLWLFATVAIQAQGNKSKAAPTSSNYAFEKGKHNFTLMQNLNYDHFKRKYNGTDNGNASDLGLNFDYNYFIERNIGIGLDFNSDFSSSKYGSSTLKSADWMTYLNFTYGTSISNNFDAYGRISVGIGQDRTKQTGYPTNKDDLFGFRFELGAPIRLCDNGNVYLTPHLGFDHLRDKFDGGKVVDNNIRFGLNLESYLFCSQTMCDLHHGGLLSRHSYDAGNSFIGYTTEGGFSFGSTKTEYPGNLTQKDHVFNGAFDLYYGYYIVKDIALGAEFSWQSHTEKDGLKYTSSSFDFMPMVTGNLPMETSLNNLFFQAGYGFGAQKTTYNSTDTKYSLGAFCFKLGYNDFISDRISFTPKVGYEWNSVKQKSTNNKSTYSGLEFEIGATAFLYKQGRK